MTDVKRKPSILQRRTDLMRLKALVKTSKISLEVVNPKIIKSVSHQSIQKERKPSVTLYTTLVRRVEDEPGLLWSENIEDDLVILCGDSRTPVQTSSFLFAMQSPMMKTAILDIVDSRSKADDEKITVMLPDFDASTVTGVINCMRHGVTMSTSSRLDRMRDLIALLLAEADRPSAKPIHKPVQKVVCASQRPVAVDAYDPQVVVKENDHNLDQGWHVEPMDADNASSLASETVENVKKGGPGRPRKHALGPKRSRGRPRSENYEKRIVKKKVREGHCPICQFDGDTIASTLDHYNQLMAGQQGFPLELLPKSPKGILRCPACLYKPIGSETAFKTHFAQHLVEAHEMRTQCQKCDFQTSSPGEYVKHMQDHMVMWLADSRKKYHSKAMSNGNFSGKCQFCNKTFRYVNDHQRHCKRKASNNFLHCKLNVKKIVVPPNHLSKHFCFR